MLSCDSFCADDAVACSPGRRFGGVQGLGGVFPDAPSIRCFPQVIESGLVSLLLQPVARHVVDCRADLDAKSRPARRKTRRSKGSVESTDNRVSARRTKCFRFDIRMMCGAASRQRSVALCKGSKKFSRDFPESMSLVSRRAFGTPPAGQKHGMFQARNIIRAGTAFSDLKTRFSALSRSHRHFAIQLAVCVTPFFLQQCIHRTAPSNAIRSGYTTTQKGCGRSSSLHC